MDDQRLHELTFSPLDRTSDQYSILAGVTHCMKILILNLIFFLSLFKLVTEIEVRDLEKSYYHLCTYSNNNRQQQITLQTFSNILTPILPPILIPGFFDAFDENRDGMKRFLKK